MGMLTFAADAGQYPVPMLVIPNRVMRELQWEYLSVAMAQHEGIRMSMRDIDGALVMMAQRGDIQPLLRVFHEHVRMIEAKYVKTDASQEAIEEVVKQGFEQIQRYISDKDLVAMLTLGNSLKAGVLVFVGLKDVFFRSFLS